MPRPQTRTAGVVEGACLVTPRLDTLDNFIFDKLNQENPDKVSEWIEEYIELTAEAQA